MLEIERTFLAKFVPEEVLKSDSKELIDIYFPRESPHPNVRLRKLGDKYQITKKHKVVADDASQHLEETIHLTKDEFAALSHIEGKKLRKIRYYFKYNNHIAEFDIFQDDLSGLVVIDFEFSSAEEMQKFIVPDFCLVDITQEEFIAGGKLCGKKLQDLQRDLDRFDYKKI